MGSEKYAVSGIFSVMQVGKKPNNGKTRQAVGGFSRIPAK